MTNQQETVRDEFKSVWRDILKRYEGDETNTIWLSNKDAAFVAYQAATASAEARYRDVIQEIVERLNNLKLAVGNLTPDKDLAMHNQIYISETIALAAPLLGGVK